MWTAFGIGLQEHKMTATKWENTCRFGSRKSGEMDFNSRSEKRKWNTTERLQPLQKEFLILLRAIYHFITNPLRSKTNRRTNKSFSTTMLNGPILKQVLKLPSRQCYPPSWYFVPCQIISLLCGNFYKQLKNSVCMCVCVFLRNSLIKTGRIPGYQYGGTSKIDTGIG